MKYFNMKNFFEFLNFLYVKVLPSAMVFLTVSLIIEIRNLPHRIAANINTDSEKIKVDTIREIVYKTATLKNKGEFYYFEGKNTGKTYKFKDHFKYNIEYPEEIFDGYITKVTDISDAKFYIWTSDSISTHINIDGYYIKAGNNSFQEISPDNKNAEPQYLQLLFPVVRVYWNKINAI